MRGNNIKSYFPQGSPSEMIASPALNLVERIVEMLLANAATTESMGHKAISATPYSKIGSCVIFTMATNLVIRMKIFMMNVCRNCFSNMVYELLDVVTLVLYL